MPTLTVKSGPAAGRSLPIVGDVVIGREDADLTIDDQEISRRHAVVRPAGRGVEIEDLGSTNGTIVDGRRIDAPMTVTAGATVEVGTTTITIELADPDTTRARGEPVAAVDQATRARDVAPAPPPPPAAAPAAPAAEQPKPASPEQGLPERRRGARLLIAGGVLAALAVLAVALVLFLGGESKQAEVRALDATITTLPLGSPESFQVSGELDGEPLENAAAVIQRRLAVTPRAGGSAVPMRGFILVTPPGGSFSLNFSGTLRLTEAGGEVVRLSGTASNGARDYEGMKGRFEMSGGRTGARSGTARYKLSGELEY